MNDKPTEQTISNLPIITKFIYSIGVLPTSYLMSMTYMEQVTWLCNYLEKTIIPALNQNGEAVQELQNLYELLRHYVNDYFDDLNVQEEINNKLDEMAEDGTLAELINVDILNNVKENVQRLYDEVKFKPIVNASMYMLDDDTDTIKARILKWKEMGCRGIIVLINFDNDNSLTILDDLTKVNTLMNYAKNNGLIVDTLKFHCNIDASLSAAKLTLYKNQIISTLEVLDAETFGIQRLCIFNELKHLYSDTATSEIKSSAISIINDLRNLGYSVGISCSNLTLGIGRMINYSEAICQAVDYFAFNYYQAFPFKKELTTYQDSINSWKTAFDSATNYKLQYPNKNFILSETGCLDNWLNMMDPSDYTLNQYPANGKTYPLYFYGLLNNQVANTDLSEVWLWYDEKMVDYTDVIEFFKYYLGGDLNE